MSPVFLDVIQNFKCSNIPKISKLIIFEQVIKNFQYSRGTLFNLCNPRVNFETPPLQQNYRQRNSNFDLINLHYADIYLFYLIVSYWIWRKV